MPDLFASSKAVLRRADHHIKDLKRAIEDFRTKNPYSTVVEFDPNFGQHILKVKFIESRVEDAACIMFDAVNNLRSSLDQMTYAIAMRHSGIDKFAPFPFASDLSKWPDRIKGLKNRLPPEVCALFEWFRPYKGGNNTLWALNHIANIKKHAVLVPVGFGRGAMLSFPNGQPSGSKFVITPAHLARKDEVAILAFSEDHPVPEMNFSASIVINHPEQVIDGQQPIALIHLMRNQVRAVLRETATTCSDLGWDIT